MKHQLKLEGAIEANGTIDLMRLAHIAVAMRKIAEGALMIRVRGISQSRGRKKGQFEEALNIRLTGIKRGSTILDVEDDKFVDTLENFQLDIFRQQAQQEIPEQSPVSLFIRAFKDALDESGEKDFIDKPLLRELKGFQRSFINEEEIFSILSENDTEPFSLKKEDFARIKILDDEIPEPEAILLSGKVEELRFSKLQVKIVTADGTVDGFLGEDVSPEQVSAYWGKQVTISGIAHYKADGKPTIEIQRLFEPGKGDDYFSKKPKAETVEQQIQRQLREKGYKNQLNEIIGKWPGDETYEELIKGLN